MIWPQMLNRFTVAWPSPFQAYRRSEPRSNGRDHHNSGFSVWLCGGGARPGMIHGATDDLGYSAIENVVDVHDLHATTLRLLGIDLTKLSIKFQGLDLRLTGVACQVISDIIA